MQAIESNVVARLTGCILLAFGCQQELGNRHFCSYFDFLLALLPITIVWNLQLKTKKKVGLCVLLGLGILAGIAAAIKGSQTLVNHVDFTWAAAPDYLWSVAEYFLNIFCGCVATLKPLYEYLVNGKPIRPAEGAAGRSMFYGSTMRSDRIRLRNVSKGSGSKSSQQSERVWPGTSGNDNSITVQQSYDIERASKNSTEPITRHDVLHGNIEYIPR